MQRNETYGVGRVTPGYEVNDTPGTTSRSLGYGCVNCRPPVRYGADFTSWVQEDPASLKTHPLPPEGRVSPGNAEGRAVGYGADLPSGITQYYPEFLKKQLNVPVIGTMMLGTLVLGAIATFVVLKKTGKIK